MIYDKTREETFYFCTREQTLVVYLLLTDTGNWKNIRLFWVREDVLQWIFIEILWFEMKSPGKQTLGTFCHLRSFWIFSWKWFAERVKAILHRKSDHFWYNVVLVSIIASKPVQPSKWFKFTEWMNERWVGSFCRTGYWIMQSLKLRFPSCQLVMYDWNYFYRIRKESKVSYLKVSIRERVFVVSNRIHWIVNNFPIPFRKAFIWHSLWHSGVHNGRSQIVIIPTM